MKKILVAASLIILIPLGFAYADQGGFTNSGGTLVRRN